MYTEVSVLVPTRGRPEQLRRMVESLYMTSEGVAKPIFRVDDDDEVTQNALIGESYVVGPRLDGYRSLPAFFNQLAEVAGGDVLMCGNDDMVFKTPGWDTLILDEANKYEDGLFDFGYSTHNSPNFPFATVSKKVVQHLGFIFDPRIFWGDVYLRDVMARFDRAIMLEGVVIDHDWMGHKPDQTFMEGNAARFFTDHNAQHEAAVQDAVRRLEELR